MNFLYTHTAFIQNPPAQYCKLPENYKPIKLRILNKKLSPGYKDTGLCENIPTSTRMRFRTKLRALSRSLKNIQMLFHHRMLLIQHMQNTGAPRALDVEALFRADYIQDLTTLEIRYYEVLLNETSPINSPRRNSINELDSIAIEHAQAEDRIQANQTESVSSGLYRLRRGVIHATQFAGQPPRVSDLSEAN